ncbi:MAG: DUF3592 domain-containing protein [Thermoguttaceae bacterium]
MARRFRYYGKKRGHRRTGSPALAGVAEAVFSAFFVLLGLAGLMLVLSGYVVPEWRANHEFVETTCRVLAKQIGEKDFGEGPLYRPEVKIQYEVGGVEYRDWHYDVQRAYSSSREDAQANLDQFELYATGHKTYSCWYDPANPSVAVLVRGYGWVSWLTFTVPISFIIIGAGGLVHVVLHWGKSAERRALLGQRGGRRDLFAAGGAGRPPFPTVPPGADITNSPGTKLKFRLPMVNSPGWAVFGTLAFCIAWNGIVAAFITMAVRSYFTGKPDWLLTLFTVPFAAIGVWAIVALVRQLLVATGIGPTLVEISDHPLAPGGQYRLFLLQSGWLTMNRLRVLLVCEEVATYRQGTDTRTETREVFRKELFRRDTFEIRGGMPFECDIDLTLHEGAMHSFAANHNEIAWTLVVEADVAGWPECNRAFPVIVRPAMGAPNR